MPLHQRRAILSKLADIMEANTEFLATAITIEVGKHIREARMEVIRAVYVTRLTADTVPTMQGEYNQYDYDALGQGWQSIIKRYPLGPLSFITPFNFPLNLSIHKIAPAIAAGCPFVLKSSDRTPLTPCLIGPMLQEAGLPDAAYSLFPTKTPEIATPIVTDERLKLLSFTGSAAVGWKLNAIKGKKRIALELGGNALCMVTPSAASKLDAILDRVVAGAVGVCGQSCISVQRLVVHDSLLEKTKAGLIARFKKITMGDPFDEQVTMGGIIAAAEAVRLRAWTEDAVQKGASLLHGNLKLEAEPKSPGATILSPILLANVPEHAILGREEAFGPLLQLSAYSDFKSAILSANEGRYGLHAGIFTSDINEAFWAFETLEVGGVVINELPTSRLDAQPYGGVKDSGIGREGPRFAIQEFTEPKVMLMKDVGVL
jgi:acyl-CoA reductase-like NAD-dependent aldehyde dehydrogenase